VFCNPALLAQAEEDGDLSSEDASFSVSSSNPNDRTGSALGVAQVVGEPAASRIISVSGKVPAGTEVLLPGSKSGDYTSLVIPMHQRHHNLIIRVHHKKGKERVTICSRQRSKCHRLSRHVFSFRRLSRHSRR